MILKSEENLRRLHVNYLVKEHGLKRIYFWEPYFFIFFGTAVFVLGIVLMVKKKKK